MIELLVVIAIIGVLATVVIITVNSARAINRENAVKYQFSQAPNIAALYLDTAGTYNGVCSSSISGGVHSIVLNALNIGGYAGASPQVSVNNQGTSFSGTYGTGVCNNSTTRWAIEVAYKNKNNQSRFYCLDVDGTRKDTATTSSPNLWHGGDTSC